MRKRLMGIFVILFAITSLSAQQITGAEYFFNTDPGFGNATTISVTEGDSIAINSNISIPADLKAGINLLFVRVADNNGVWSFPEVSLLWISNASTQINAMEYFFDTDPGIGLATAIENSIHL